MSNDVPFMLISGTLSIEGLLILHFASRPHSADREAFDLVRGIAFLFAGLFLVLPLLIWLSSYRHLHPSHESHVSPTAIFILAAYLDAAFFWFIWKLNSCTFKAPEVYSNPWEENWGASYGRELKTHIIGSVFERLQREGKAGNLIVDIGSGASPVSQLLRTSPDRKFIFMDIAGSNSATPDSLTVRMDAENITRPDLLSHKKALLRVCAFLKIDPRGSAREEHATAIVFSDILNYVNFRAVLSGFSEFLKSNGRIVIVNLPTRGIRERFSKDGLKKNEDLYAYLAEHHLEIEYKDFPCRAAGVTDESEEMIVLVARKRQGEENDGSFPAAVDCAANELK